MAMRYPPDLVRIIREHQEMKEAIQRVRIYCNAVMLDGMGVPVDDPRFIARMTAHMLLNRLDGEQ